MRGWGWRSRGLPDLLRVVDDVVLLVHVEATFAVLCNARGFFFSNLWPASMEER